LATDRLQFLIALKTTGEQAAKSAVASVEASLRSLRQTAQTLSSVRLDNFAGIQKLSGALQTANAAVTLVTQSIGALSSALQAVGSGFAAFYGEGIRFARTLENTELSIRTLVANNLLARKSITDVGEAFRVAGAISADQLQKLKLAAIDTSVSFEDLSKAFQEGLGSGISAGFNPDQIRQLTLQLGQLGAALGMPGFQLPQEIRAILTGQIDRNARIGLSLFNTEEDRKKLQQLLKTDVAQAFAFIQEKLQAVTVGGQLAARSFDGLLGNAKEALTLFATAGSGRLFTGLKQALAQVQDGLISITRNLQTGVAESVKLSPAFEQIARVADEIGAALSRSVLNALNYVLAKVNQLGQFLERNPALVEQIGREFEKIFDAIVDIGRAILEGLTFEDARSGAQAVIDTLQNVRVVIEAIAALASAVAAAVRGWFFLVDTVRWAFQSVLNVAASVLDTIARIAATIAVAVGAASSLASVFAVVAISAQTTASALRSATSAQQALLGGQKPGAGTKTEQKPDLSGVFGAPKAPKAGGGKGGGGRQAEDPVLKQLEARRAEAARIERLIAAEADRNYRLERARIEAATAALRDSFDRRRISAEQYYRELSKLQEAQAENERRRADQERAREFAKLQQAIIDRETAAKIKDPKARDREMKRLLDEEAQAQARIIDLTTRLAEVEAERETARLRTARENEESYRREQAAIEGLQAALVAATSDKFTVERLRAEQEYLETLRRIRSELTQANADREAVLATLTDGEREQLRLAEELRAKRLEQIAVDQAVAELQRAITETKREQAALAEQMRLAGYTEAEIQKAVNAVYEQRKATLDALAQKAREAAQALPTQENVDAVRDAIDAVQSVKVVSRDAGAQIRSDLASSLENLFAGLITNARNAKEAFKQFALSVVQSIAKIIAQMLVLKLLQGALGGFLGKIGLGGVLPGIPGKAAGGSVAANAPYIVGEKGPELFVPRISGTIVPNDALAAAPATAATQPVTIVNRVDTGSFDDHLMGAAGERIVINHIRANRGRIAQMLRTV
jgi:hypothetical protein